MDREQLYYVLFEQQKEFHEKKQLVPREQTESILSLFRLKLPIIITGVRRAGKSTLLKILKKELNLRDTQCLYLNFNDERLISFSSDDFQKVIDFMHELNYQNHCYLFIDEIQEVEHWEKWVDRIKEKYPLVVTGSNSKLLSKEISTVLTGRSVNVSLYPFSFREVLAFKNVCFDATSLDLKIQSQVRKEFATFINTGGIPKFVVDGDSRILSELYENILYRDVIKRFKPHLEKPIKEVSLYFLSTVAKRCSFRNISVATEIKNIATVKSIADTFEKAFLFFFIPKFDFSLQKQLQNPRKGYCVDNGFVTQVGFRFSEDRGRLLENAVFIELKRTKKEIYYFSGKGECDFVLRVGSQITDAIQVTWELNENNREREIGGLLEAMENCKLKKGLILTFDQQEEIILPHKKIQVIPVWKWLFLNLNK